MNKRQKLNKIKKGNIIVISLLLVVIFSSILLLNIICSSTKKLNKYEDDFYNYWSDNIQMNLRTFETKFELDIEQKKIDPKDKEELKNWLSGKSNLISDNKIDNLIVTNIEYELNTNLNDFEEYINNCEIDDEKNKIIILNEYKKLIKEYSDNDFSSNCILDLIKKYSKSIANITQLSYNNINGILMSRITRQERIIFSLTNSNIKKIISNKKSNRSYKIDDLWVETTTIPNGLLGLNGQPEFIQTNVPNINYNKISIYISSKENDVLYSFNEYKKSCQYIVNISVVLLSIISIFSIIIITLIFKDLLRLNLNGGDTHAD